MVRNQFYILIIGIVVILLLEYSYLFFIFSREISNFASYYANIARLIYIKAFLEKYQRFFYLDNSIVYPIKVIYECDKHSIALRNNLNLKNVSIFDKEFNYLPTSFDDDYINFTLINKEIYSSNLCIFKGYIVQNEKFISNSNIIGESALFYEIYLDRKIKINKDIYLKLINNFVREVVIDFDGNCTEIKYTNPDINLKLNSLSVENLNLYYIRRYGDILTVGIENVGKCPIDIRNFLYESDKFYNIIPNLTVNATSFIVYPGKIEIFNFSNFSDILCLNSLGFKNCISFFINIQPDYLSSSCAIPGTEYKTGFSVKVSVNKNLKNPLKLVCYPDCYFNPEIVYPGIETDVDLILAYICPTTKAWLVLEIKAIDTITNEEYYANPVTVEIYNLAVI